MLNISLSDEILLSKAQVLGEKLKIEDFGYSQGWLNNFKKRFNIKLRKLCGESKEVDEFYVQEERRKLQKDLEGVDQENIFNFDETALFYQAQPTRTFSSVPMNGTKISKQRVTIGLCCNFTGTYKCTPVLINKSKKPKSFKYGFNPNMYVEYYYNKKAWMTQELFTKFIQKLDNEMKKQKRKIILLLDNSRTHMIKYVPSNITIKFFGPNLTSHLQPLDSGIIMNFKLKYRKLLMEYYLHQMDNKDKFEKLELINIKDAIRFIRTAWNQVSVSTINNCFNHVQILKKSSNTILNELSNTISSELSNTISSELSNTIKQNKELEELDSLIRNFGEKLVFDPIINSEEYINCDSKEDTTPQLTDDDIIQMVQNHAEDNNAEEEKNEEKKNE